MHFLDQFTEIQQGEEEESENEGMYVEFAENSWLNYPEINNYPFDQYQ